MTLEQRLDILIAALGADIKRATKWSAWLPLVSNSGNTYWIGSSSTPTALEPTSILVSEGLATLRFNLGTHYTMSADNTQITFADPLANAADTFVKGVKF